jgi:hypothetical protein
VDRIRSGAGYRGVKRSDLRRQVAAVRRRPISSPGIFARGVAKVEVPGRQPEPRPHVLIAVRPASGVIGASFDERFTDTPMDIQTSASSQTSLAAAAMSAVQEVRGSLMSFNRLLADGEPAKAARAAIIMAQALVDELTMRLATRALARKVLDLGVEDLTKRICAARQSTPTTAGSTEGADE